MFFAIGQRSAMAVQAATDARLAGPAHIAGGLEAWKRAGGAVLPGQGGMACGFGRRVIRAA